MYGQVGRDRSLFSVCFPGKPGIKHPTFHTSVYEKIQNFFYFGCFGTFGLHVCVHVAREAQLKKSELFLNDRVVFKDGVPQWS